MDPNTLLAGMLVGSVGFAFCRYGRRERRAPQLLAGITLMVFPGFVAGPLMVFACAGLVVAGMTLALRLGA